MTDGLSINCDIGNHEHCTIKDCECGCHLQKPAEIDDSVLEDAARMLDAASRRLKKAIASRHYPSARKRLISEAVSNIHAAEARIK